MKARTTTTLGLVIVGGLAFSVAAEAARGGRADLARRVTPPTAIPTIAEPLARAEYHFSPLDSGGFTAPNRASGLRTRIAWHGVEVVSRTDGAAGFRLALELTAYGRQGCLAPVATAAPQASDARVEFARGALVEWYVNDPRGIEQGFDLTWPPHCDDPTGPLVLVLRWETDLLPRLTDGGRTVELRPPGGGPALLRYADLLVLDAEGRELPAGLRIGDGRVSIEIDDRDAVWPLRVDPLMTTIGWDLELDQAEAELGLWAVATAGDVNGDGYDDVIVGAYGWDNGLIDQGAAFVYHGSATGLDLSPDWVVEGSQTGAFFAQFVAPAGDVNGDGYDDITVGAPWEDQLVPVFIQNVGRVYLYFGSPTGLETTPAWSTVGGPGCESFTPGSNDVCIANTRYGHGDFNGDGFEDVVINNMMDITGPLDFGRALVFDGSPSGLAATPSWSWEDGIDEFSNFANSAGDVNGDGYDDVIVGNPGYSNGESEEGQVLLFYGSASGVSPTPGFAYESDNAGAGGNGATLGDANSLINAWGAMGPAGVGDVNGDGFGDIIAAAVNYTNPEFLEGAAFVWLGSATGPVNPPQILESNQETEQGSGNPAWWGWVADPAGDVNGDGFDDVVIGSPTYDDGAQDNGRYQVHRGKPSGLSANPSWTFSGPGFFLWPTTMGTAGDVDGDGTAELIGGWGLWDNPEHDEGRATLWYGSCDGTDADGDARCTFSAYPDCNDDDATVWSTPGEVRLVTFTDKTTLGWSAPLDPGGTAPLFDTLRSDTPSDFSAATCVESGDGGDTVAAVVLDPAPGQQHAFLVRAVNACPAGAGTLGSGTGGSPRSGPSCP